MTKLKQRRIKLGLTQEDVAKKVGVSLYAYQLWERGVNMPKADNMDKLKAVLKFDVDIKQII